MERHDHRATATSPTGHKVEISDDGTVRITGPAKDTTARTLLKLAKKLGIHVELHDITTEETRPQVYGPVPSRRLGTSLGIDVCQGKCTQDCQYCSVGVPTKVPIHDTHTTDPQPLLQQLQNALKTHTPDAITFAGVGEPTLCDNLSEIAEEITRIKPKNTPLVLLTNTTHPSRHQHAFDEVIASLDAADPNLHQSINRPHPTMTLDHILSELEKMDTHNLTVEILLCRLPDGTTNAEPTHLRHLAEILGTLDVQKVQLNTVSRPPAKGNARPVTEEEMLEAKKTLEKTVERVEVYP